MLCSPADMMEDDSLYLSGFMDDLGIVADFIPASMDADVSTFSNIELSPIEDHSRSLDMYFVPRSKVGPQDLINRHRGSKQTKDKMLLQDQTLGIEPQTDTTDMVSQFQQFGHFSSNSDSSSGNQEESPRKNPRIHPPRNASFGNMLGHHSENGVPSLTPSLFWPLDDPPFGTLTPTIPHLNLSFNNVKSEPKPLPFVTLANHHQPGNFQRTFPRSRPNESSTSQFSIHSPRVHTSTRVKTDQQQDTQPEDSALDNMLATFGNDKPKDAEVLRAVEKQRRKRRHALTERSRTRALSAKISLLGENLNASGVTCKMEKLPILTTAVDYVYTMQAAIHAKQQKQKQLKATIALLRAQIAAVGVPVEMKTGSQKYGRLFPHKPFPVAAINAQFKIIDCSNNFLTMLRIPTKSRVLNQSLPGLLSGNCPEVEQLFSYCQKLLSGHIKNESRPCLAALVQGSHYYAMVNQLDSSRLQLSILQESNARQIPGVTISAMSW